MRLIESISTKLSLAAIVVTVVSFYSTSTLSAGFAKNATGGDYGDVCVVTSSANNGVGTLRACVNSKPSPASARLIVFDKSVLGSRPKIRLSSTLMIPSNTTIDGGGSGGKAWIIALSKNKHLLQIASSRNVIIRNLRIQQRGKSRKGDALNINRSQLVMVRNVEFSRCGDECVNVTNRSKRISIFKSKFENSYYGILVDRRSNKVSIIQNSFRNVTRRSPRIASGNAEILKNKIQNWGGSSGDYAIAIVGKGKATIKQNVFSTFRANKKAHLDFNHLRGIGVGKIRVCNSGGCRNRYQRGVEPIPAN